MILPQRPRRLRSTAALRDMMRETSLRPENLMLPLFAEEGNNVRKAVDGMPGVERQSIDVLVDTARRAQDAGLCGVLLFASVDAASKDNSGAAACDPNGLLPRAIHAIRAACSEFTVASDVALDPYSVYGHDGIVEGQVIVNDATVEVLARMSVMHAQAGANIVAPSDMMDGRVGEIRGALDAAGRTDVGIMSYTAKYASCLYGPFRGILDSAPAFGDKRSYQMDPANAREALREAALDAAEGADILMVKPAGWYLDIIARLSATAERPVAAYQVSGEYAMMWAAAQRGSFDFDRALLESTLSIRRAGASLILTYGAMHVAEMLS